MADYYSILKKTIASLPENNGAARRSVYSRARNAIVNQLKAYEPPLAPSEITAEQLRLEEAIRKVEAEAARESLGLGSAGSVSTDKPASRPIASGQTAAAPSTETQTSDTESAEPAGKKKTAETAVAAPSPLKETLAEAAPLGSAANKAVQSAKDAFAPSEDEGGIKDGERKEPVVDTPTNALPEDEVDEPEDDLDQDDEGLFAEVPEPSAQVSAPRRDRTDRKSASELLKTSSSRGSIKSLGLVAALVVVVLGIAAVLYSQMDTISGLMSDSGQPEMASADRPVETTPQPVVPAESVADNGSSKNTDRLLGDNGEPLVAPDARTVTTTVITPTQDTEPAPVATEPVVAATAEPPALPEPATSVPTIDTPVSSASETAPIASAPSIDADVPGIDEEAPVPAEPQLTTPALVNAGTEATQDTPPEQTLASTAPSEPVQPGSPQRSILYEEGEEASGAGTASQGDVVWGLNQETDLNGRDQAVLNASVDIPDRNVRVEVRIKPNDDTSLPASHLVEIKYDFPEGYSGGDIVSVPGLVMKPTEEARGDALLGASVKVSPGYFWIALSSLPNERDRNLALLRERGWIDIPMLYDNGKRGILTLEKGAIGADAVEKAIAAWKAS